MSVLTGVSREIGSPQPIKNGKEMNDIKSCNCMLLRSEWYQRVFFFILFDY
jgi:hypothetical protein